MKILKRDVDSLGHVAYLDPFHGLGLLVRPLRAEDVVIGGWVESVHDTAWSAALRVVYALGFVPMEDEDGEIVTEGYLLDGCEVIALDRVEPDDSIDFEKICQAMVRLREEVGVMTCSTR